MSPLAAIAMVAAALCCLATLLPPETAEWRFPVPRVETRAQAEPADIDIVALLTQADAATLDRIDGQIVAIKDEIEAFAATRRPRLDALRQFRKLVDRSVNGVATKPAKRGGKGRGRGKAGRVPDVIPRVHRQPGRPESVVVTESADPKLRERMYDLLFDEGSMPINEIAKRLECKPRAVGLIARTCPWFEPGEEDDIRIAKAGGRQDDDEDEDGVEDDE